MKRLMDNKEDIGFPLGTLPPEVQDIVMSHMEPRDFLNMVQTSTEYAVRAFDERIWRQFVLRDFQGELVDGEELPFFALTWRSYYLACRRLLGMLEKGLCVTGKDAVIKTARDGSGAMLCISFFRHYYFLTQLHELTEDVFERNDYNVLAVMAGMFGGVQDPEHWSFAFLVLCLWYFNHGAEHFQHLVDVFVNSVRRPVFQENLKQTLSNAPGDPEKVQLLLLCTFLRHLNQPNLMTAWYYSRRKQISVPLQCATPTLVMFEREAKLDFLDMYERGMVSIRKNEEEHTIQLRCGLDAYFYFNAIALSWSLIAELFQFFNT